MKPARGRGRPDRSCRAGACRPTDFGSGRPSRLQRPNFTGVGDPRRGANGEEAFGIIDLLVAKKPGPGSVRGTAETANRAARRIALAGGWR